MEELLSCKQVARDRYPLVPLNVTEVIRLDEGLVLKTSKRAMLVCEFESHGFRCFTARVAQW